MKKILMLIFLGLVNVVSAQNLDLELYKSVLKNDIPKAEELIQKGADINYVHEAGTWMAANLLITAINHNSTEMSEILLRNHIDVNWKDGFKSSAILYAASSGNIELFDLLLTYGANIHELDEEGHTVMTAAEESTNPDMVKHVFKRIHEADTK